MSDSNDRTHALGGRLDMLFKAEQVHWVVIVFKISQPIVCGVKGSLDQLVALPKVG